jgi:hypothetical protein
MRIVPNGCGCDPAMIQPSRQSLENVETPGARRSRAPSSAFAGSYRDFFQKTLRSQAVAQSFYAVMSHEDMPLLEQ